MSGLAWPALVFVEGLPGSGKSTTAQWIAHEMEARGRPSRWIYEAEMPYRSETGWQGRLSVRDDALVIEGLVWWRSRLLPRAHGVFDVECWPFRLTFEADTTGMMSRFRLDGPDLAGSRLSGAYDRLAS